MSWSVEFLPFVPWPVLWGIAAAGAVLLALLFWRSNRGAVLRLLSFALLLLAVANPHLKQEDREPLNDVLAVVVDDSQSQAIAGRTGRTNESRKALEDKLKKFPESRRALRAFGLDLGRQRARRHHAVHRSRPGPVRRAARPAGRGDHDHRRRGA